MKRHLGMPTVAVILVASAGCTVGHSTASPPSTTPQTVTVPNVVGFRLSPAIVKLENNGLRTDRLNHIVSDGPVDFTGDGPLVVVRQSPEAGDIVPSGASVRLALGLVPLA
jgi:beta-lactam-binding protein with PASTA domain